MLPTSLSIQSLSTGSKTNYVANSTTSASAKVSSMQSVQSNGNHRPSVGVSSASAIPTVTGSPSSQQSQQQQRLQQSPQSTQQYSNKIRQKSPAQLISPVQAAASNFANNSNSAAAAAAAASAASVAATAALITPENATQLLATMQPQPPSSLAGQYFKQTSPSCLPKQQASPIQQSPPGGGLYGSLKNSPSATTPSPNSRSIHQQQSPINLNTSQNQQFVTAQQQQNLSVKTALQQATSASTGSYFPENSLSSVIRLPTVPIPTTSMFSSMTPVISQASATQNYLFTNLPQHSTQPNFDQLIQTKMIAGSAGNRGTPVSNSNDAFQQFMNMPK